MNYSSSPLGPSAAAEESAEAETDGGGELVRSGCVRSGHGTYDGQTGTWAGKTSSAPFFFVLFSSEIVLGVFQQLRTMRTHDSSLV